MTIGQLYNAANVVVGQAACYFAPANTALPTISATVPNIADPFDPTPFTSYSFIVGSATSVVFTYNAVSATSLTLAGTTASLVQANVRTIPALAAAIVTANATTTGYNIVLPPVALQNGVLTYVPTGGSGSSLVGPLWTPCGATDQGWKFGANKSTQSITIEEQSTPVATTVTSQSISIAGSLSEDIAQTLAVAFNMLAAKTAAATTNPAYTTLTLTDTPLLYAVCLVSSNAPGLVRWTYAPVWTQLTNSSADFRRASAKHMYPVSFETVCATNQIQILDFTAPHS